jgi:hypothetical protein
MWAVGNVGGGYPILQHWDGARLTQTLQTEIAGVLNDVATISPTDAWAVGQLNNSGYPKTLIEHWDGTSWTIVPSPSPGLSDYLYGVSAAAPGDVWAAGDYSPPGNQGLQPLYLHWDGTSWQHVDGGSISFFGGVIYGITATSPSDVWAVGYTGTDQGFVYAPLTEHWDGSKWSVVPISPPPGEMGTSELLAVDSLSASDAWAVGYGVNTGPLSEHWDGASWNFVDMPGTGDLFGVSAASANDVWAVGSQGLPNRPVTQRWDGAAWSRITSPNPLGGSGLLGVTTIASTDAWAVGEYADPVQGSQPFVIRSRGLCPP